LKHHNNRYHHIPSLIVVTQRDRRPLAFVNINNSPIAFVLGPSKLSSRLRIYNPSNQVQFLADWLTVRDTRLVNGCTLLEDEDEDKGNITQASRQWGWCKHPWGPWAEPLIEESWTKHPLKLKAWKPFSFLYNGIGKIWHYKLTASGKIRICDRITPIKHLELEIVHNK